MIEYPCHKLPKEQWCDHAGRGGFMGHTCFKVPHKTCNMKVTSFELKLGLLDYFRFERQWVAVDEFRGADVIADTGSKVIEVEVKITKNDLCNGEKYKTLKHLAYSQGKQYRRCYPNEYYFCVPWSLVKDAHEVVEALNPDYGIIIFDSKLLLDDLGRGYRHAKLGNYLCVVRRARKLHAGYSVKQQWLIAKRAASKLITQMQAEYMAKVTQ